MLKGYVERVFGVGFGYEAIMDGGSHPLLTGRKMISFTSTGSENMWLVDSGSWNAVRKVFNERLSTACGLESVDHVNFGGVGGGISPERLAEAVEQVREAVADLFPVVRADPSSSRHGPVRGRGATVKRRGR